MAEDVGCTPPAKRPRTLSSEEQSSSSSPAPSERPVDMAVKRVSPDVLREWPGLPRGVKFDPSDEELLGHLLAKVGKGEAKPHPLIGEFITTLEEDDRFGYTHPQTLAGTKQDGSVSYFFHRRFKEYNSGTSKHQQMQNADFGVVWWHKIGKTKAVTIDGIHQGCKKIMVLYVNMKEGDQPKKTNWVMLQYYIGRGGDSEEEFVVSKIFYQRSGNAQDLDMEIAEAAAMEAAEVVATEAEAVVKPTSLRPKIRAENQRAYRISMKASPQQAAASHNRAEEAPTHGKYAERDKRDILRKEDPQGGEIELLDLQQHVECIITDEDLCQAQSSCSAEAERSLSETSDNALIGIQKSVKDPSSQNGEASTQHSNVGSEVDYSSEFTMPRIFNSREEMIKWTRDIGRIHGFVIVIKTSVSGPGKKPRVTFGCERGGKYRERYKGKTEKIGKITGTKKCDCPFSLKGKKLPAEDDWILVVDCGLHNHPAADQLVGHSYAGRLTHEENSMLAEMCNNLVPAREILSTLKQRDPLNAATIKTIYNARQRYRVAQKAKEPHIQQLEYAESIQHLEDNESQIQQIEENVLEMQIENLSEVQLENEFELLENVSEIQLEHECLSNLASSSNTCSSTINTGSMGWAVA